MTPPAIQLVPESEDLDRTALSVLEQGRAIRITDRASYESASVFRRDVIKPLLRQVDETFDPMIKKNFEAHRLAVATKKNVAGPIADVDKAIGAQQVAFLEAEERARLAEERRLTEEARKKREDDQVAEAAALEKAGHREEAAEVFAKPVLAPVVTLAPPAVAGVTSSKRYSAKVLDLMTLVKAVAEGRAPLAAIQADGVALNRLAVALKDGFSVPGCELVVETHISNRAAR